MVPFLLWESLHGIFFSTSFGILSCSFDENRKVEQVVSIAVCFLYIHNNKEKCNIVLILFVCCSEQKNHDSNNSDDVTLTHHDPGIYIYIQVHIMHMRNHPRNTSCDLLQYMYFKNYWFYWHVLWIQGYFQNDHDEAINFSHFWIYIFQF